MAYSLLIVSPTAIDCLIPLLDKLKSERNRCWKSSADYLFEKTGKQLYFQNVAGLLN